MLNYWEQFSDYIQSREKRERVVLGLTIITIVYGIMEFGFALGINSEKSRLEAEAASLLQNIETLQAEETVLLEAIKNDPNTQRRNEIKRLEALAESLDKQLSSLSVGLINASKFPEALRDVLSSNTRLKVIGMKTLAPIELSLTQTTQMVPEITELDRAVAKAEGITPEEASRQRLRVLQEQSSSIGVFKHSVIFELKGSYFEVVNYLEQLEHLPWKFYWESLDYQVDAYPKANIIIEVYTLSTEKGVIGV